MPTHVKPVFVESLSPLRTQTVSPLGITPLAIIAGLIFALHLVSAVMLERAQPNAVVGPAASMKSDDPACVVVRRPKVSSPSYD
jgi:hypothetical protein